MRLFKIVLSLFIALIIVVGVKFFISYVSFERLEESTAPIRQADLAGIQTSVPDKNVKDKDANNSSIPNSISLHEVAGERDIDNTGNILIRNSGGNHQDAQEENIYTDENYDNQEIFITAGELDLIDRLSLGDKLTGMVILTKIGNECKDKIFSTIQGGVTVEELNEVRALLKKELSEQDINKLEQLLENIKKQSDHAMAR